jgi:hypothetical protein
MELGFVSFPGKLHINGVAARLHALMQSGRHKDGSI